MKVTSGAIEMTWDPVARLAVLTFDRDTRATGPDATVLVDAFRSWLLNEVDRPFGLLGDGGKLSGVDAEYRAVWGKFFREHRERAFVAFFNMGPIIRIAAEMFRIGTRVQMKAFAKEIDARAWLSANGITA